MVIYRFPQESGDGQSSSDGRGGRQSEAKSPDFIYIDEERKNGAGAFQGDRIFAQEKEKKPVYPFLMRFATLVIAAALTVWTLLLFAVFLATACFAAILLFQPSVASRLASRIWGIICSMSAYALAFYVATFSPIFGFGILGLYTMQHGKAPGSGIFGRFFKSP